MPDSTDSQTIIQLAQGHIAILIGRNWPAISELLEESEEVNVSAKITITERTPEVGEHSDVDHRVKTTISFSKKVSDSTESALSDGSKGAPLTCPHGNTLDVFCQACADEAKAGNVFVPPVDPERFPETGYNEKERLEARETLEHAAQAIGTSIADKLAQAAQGVTLAPVVVDFPANYPADKYRAIWRKAAKKQKWPEAAIDLLDGIAQTTQLDATLDADGAAQRVLDVLKAHSISVGDNEYKAQVADSQAADTADRQTKALDPVGETE